MKLGLSILVGFLAFFALTAKAQVSEHKSGDGGRYEASDDDPGDYYGYPSKEAHDTARNYAARVAQQHNSDTWGDWFMSATEGMGTEEIRKFAGSLGFQEAAIPRAQ
jgi:hypothetical protein